MRFTTKLLPSRAGNLGILQLNNPKAFHALTLDMMHAWQDVLTAWQKDDTMCALLVKSCSDELKRPAFCAGGDIKTIYQSLVAADDDDDDKVVVGQGVPGMASAEFFRQEYIVNHALGTNFVKKPQIRYVQSVCVCCGSYPFFLQSNLLY